MQRSKFMACCYLAYTGQLRHHASLLRDVRLASNRRYLSYMEAFVKRGRPELDLRKRKLLSIRATVRCDGEEARMGIRCDIRSEWGALLFRSLDSTLDGDPHRPEAGLVVEKWEPMLELSGDFSVLLFDSLAGGRLLCCANLSTCLEPGDEISLGHGDIDHFFDMRDVDIGIEFEGRERRSAGLRGMGVATEL